MDAILYSDFRKNPQKVMNTVCDNCEPIIILRKNGKKVVMMSYVDYSSLEETAYLLGSPTMAKRLQESLEGFQKRQGVERQLVEEE